MEIFERIIVGVLFGVPGVIIIAYNYYRVFSFYFLPPKKMASPAYIIGGILGAIGVVAILGDEWKNKWYFILIPIVLDWGLCIVSFIRSLLYPVTKDNEEKYNDSGNDDE